MNNATGASALREFLLGLVEGVSARKLPAVFRSLARRTLGSAPSEEAIDDVVSAFLLKLVEATQRNSPGSARNLLLLEDAPLLRVVRYRLKQVACEQYPRWGLVKSLRAQVRRAMAEKLPTGVETLPETLLSADRLCSIRVAEATAFVLGQPDPPRRTVPDVSEHLSLIHI